MIMVSMLKAGRIHSLLCSHEITLFAFISFLSAKTAASVKRFPLAFIII
jgi:hypothetical protein